MNIDPRAIVVQDDMADNPLVREFLEFATHSGQTIEIGDPTPKKELYGTYAIRLQRYLDGDGPECEGLDDLVSKLRGPGSVDLVGLRADSKTYLAAFDESGTLISVTTVGRFDRNPKTRQ